MEKVVGHKHRWWILVAVGLFTFMSTLDGSIVNIALPIISDDLGVNMNQAEWVVSVYLMAICVFLLFFGKVGDSIGKIKIFKIGTLVFVFGSFLCGIPGSLPLLLVARVIQAIGASMTMATNNGIITEIFPFEERGRALGLMGSFVSLGAIAGPGLGGIILAHFSWSYIFWINVPLGIVTILFGWYLLPKSEIKTHQKIDVGGFLLFGLFICLFFGGIFIGQEIGFNSIVVWLMLVLSVVSIISFYYYEKRQEVPLVQFELFHNQLFTISLITAMLIFVTNFFSNVVTPFYLQEVRGLNPSMTGLLMMIYPVIMVIGAPISGYFTDKKGPHIVTLLGLITITIAQMSYLLLKQQTTLWLFGMIMVLVGVGNAMFGAPNNTIIMSSVEKKDLGVAGSMNALARNFGMIVGVTLSTTVLYQSMSYKMSEKVTGYVADRPDVFIYGMHVTYIMAVCICLFATLLTIFRLKKSKKGTNS